MSTKHKHIAFCINNKYSLPCAVLIESIIHYNETLSFHFHIISKDISEENKTKITFSVNKNRNNKINFYKMTSSYDDHLTVLKTDHVSVETYYRFFLCDLLDNKIDKVLYLDVDILCTGNLEELFNTNLLNHPCAMGLDSSYKDTTVFNRLDYDLKYGYYCAGVMLINLDYWRKNDIKNHLLYLIKRESQILWFHDQDAINKLCHEKILELHPKYNCMTHFWWYYAWINPSKYNRKLTITFIPKQKWSQIKEAVEKPIFLHLCGQKKIWYKGNKDFPYKTLWNYFLQQTQFINKDLSLLQLTNKTKLLNFIKYLIKKILSKLQFKDYFENETFPTEIFENEKKILKVIYQI